jgi:hypothetical protein
MSIEIFMKMSRIGEAFHQLDTNGKAFNSRRKKLKRRSLSLT